MAVRRNIFTAAVIVLLTSVAAAPAAAQRPDSTALVVRFGTDTLAMEQWVRTGDRLDAVSVTRSPRTVVRRWSVRFGPDGRVTHVAAGDAEPSAIAQPGAIPTATGFYAPQALALAQAARARDTLATVPVLAGSNVQELRVRRVGTDNFEIVNAAGAVTSRARLTRDGELLFLESGSTTVERVDWFDIERWAREFEARDARGEALGPLSTRDTVRATVAGANLVIDYSRPAVRGRTIFGGLVPYGSAWRTGADDATTLTTDRAIRIGDVRLEPGTYSLYTVPGREDWLLGINRGTDMAAAMAPSPEMDVGRARMATRELDELVERFTITLEPQQNGALLRLHWEHTEASVPITVER
jgi:hypothetical protein